MRDEQIEQFDSESSMNVYAFPLSARTYTVRLIADHLATMDRDQGQHQWRRIVAGHRHQLRSLGIDEAQVAREIVGLGHAVSQELDARGWFGEVEDERPVAG